MGNKSRGQAPEISGLNSPNMLDKTFCRLSVIHEVLLRMQKKGVKLLITVFRRFILSITTLEQARGIVFALFAPKSQ
jgi:hypothetical protein